MSERTSKDYQLVIRRFLKASKGIVSKKGVKEYLGCYLQKAAKRYNNQLDALRAFIGTFLKRNDIIGYFKKAQQPFCEPDLPNKKQAENGFYSLTDAKEKCARAFATSGLRKNEALGLRVENIDFKLRCIKANHHTRTKNSGIAFLMKNVNYI